MMARYVVVGAGPVGAATVRLLAEEGHDVRVVTRSGRDIGVSGATAVALDAGDAGALAREAVGAAALFNCANPRSYDQWQRDWPPLAGAMLRAAQDSGAVLVITGNLYGYRPRAGWMREGDPLDTTTRKGQIRARMWAEALAAHEAGRVQVTEVRGSDYYGPEVLGSHAGERLVPRVLTNRPVHVVGSAEQPHSWTYVPDVARTLVTVASDARAWGRAWHVPTAPPVTQREFVQLLAVAAAVPRPKVAGTPGWVLRAAGMAVPLMRELAEMAYQFEEPFVLDSQLTSDTFGLAATPLAVGARATVRWWRDRLAAAA